MARVLTAEWHRIPAAARADALRAWRTRREQLARTGVRHWVFASADDPESYLEFAEAGDVAALRAARAGAGLPDAAPILTELELT